MNKNDKRQNGLRNKLFAAIAMLLVSSIMMVSSTYAWFTLSTAPEVQGITTTVGANGNLEIALMPYNGEVSDITSGVGDANKGWYNTFDAEGNVVVGKNYTWGNLLDVSEGYSLDEITLLPARLDITKSEQIGGYATLAENPLQIATYGADGRIDQLVGGKVGYGAKDNVQNPTVAGFLLQDATTPRYGVRVLGTSSTQSDTELNFRSNLSAITTNKTSAQNTLSASLLTYGDALATIALKHAQAEGNDTNNYVADVPAIKAMVADLSKADAAVEEALYNALLALTNTKLVHDIEAETGTAGTLHNAVKSAKDGAGFSLTSVWSQMGPIEDLIARTFPELKASYDKWVVVHGQIATTKAAADTLPTTGTVLFTDLSAALNGLMNVDAITINGKPAAEAKQNVAAILNQGGLLLEMNDGSGVYASFAELVGTIGNTITLPEGMMFGGIGVGGVKVNIATTTTPEAGPMLDQTRTKIAVNKVAGGSADVNAIDVTYGYALDFVFRTNAANSNLLLQSDAAQRVYGDSQNAATMGHGSTMSFDGTFNNLNSLASMMSGIRVVFTDTLTGNNVYGIAKVQINGLDMILLGNKVENDEEEDVAAMNPLQLTANEDAYGDVTLTWTNQGVANTVTTEAGLVNQTTKQTYTKFTVKGVKENAAGDGLEIDDTVTTVYHVYDQDITLEGELALMEYTITDNDVLSFTGVKGSQALKTLDQNVPTAITALVYLDGDYIDNSDVTNSENGISTTGKLNLQFASSANLVPMTNTGLKDSVGVELPELPEGWTIDGETMTDKNADYSFSVTAPADFNGTYTVYYTTDAEFAEWEALTADGAGTSYTIVKDGIDGNIQIKVDIVPAETEAPATESVPTESQDNGETEAPEGSG